MFLPDIPVSPFVALPPMVYCLKIPFKLVQLGRVHLNLSSVLFTFLSTAQTLGANDGAVRKKKKNKKKVKNPKY